MISVGILSYNSPITLKNTLQSYKYYGLLDITDDVFCVIQPSDKSFDEIKICSEFGLKYYLEDYNNMMLGGMKRVFNEAKYECVLWSENDFRIHTPKEEVIKIINYSKKLISKRIVDLVKIRSLKIPGHPIETKDKYNKINDITKTDYSCYFIDNPEIKYPKYIKKYNKNPRMLIMNSKHCGYTNNCFITSKKFFNEIILKNSKGNPHIEPDIDKVWSDLDLKVGISDGFLTHVRLDGHTNCWCCNKKSGGVCNTPKCSCCNSDYLENIEFLVDENGNDISKFQTGTEWLNNL